MASKNSRMKQGAFHDEARNLLRGLAGNPHHICKADDIERIAMLFAAIARNAAVLAVNTIAEKGPTWEVVPWIEPSQVLKGARIAVLTIDKQGKQDVVTLERVGDAGSETWIPLHGYFVNGNDERMTRNPKALMWLESGRPPVQQIKGT